MSQLVYFNARLIPEKQARVSILSSGFLYGEGLFETMRTYNRRVFALDRHITRLLDGAKRLNLGVRLSRSSVKKAVLATVGASKLQNAYVRLNLWQDAGGTGIACFTKRLAKYPLRLYHRGARAIVSDIRINESSPLCAIKSFNFLIYRLARQEAYERDADEAILLNSKGYIAEAAHSNIFLVKNNTVITPCLESGCLPGITRSIVLELARGEDISIKETLVRPGQLFNAEEAFLTNSLIEIMPISKVGKRKIGRGYPGKITRLLMDRYRELVKKRSGDE